MRVEGAVERVSEGESTEYFQSRPRGSQVGAWASNQSRPIESRQALEAQFEGAKVRPSVRPSVPSDSVPGGGLGVNEVFGSVSPLPFFPQTHDTHTRHDTTRYTHTHPKARFEAAGEGTPIPKPPHWGGFRLVPDRVEFWKGRQSRLHDRIAYTLKDGGGWAMERLQP